MIYLSSLFFTYYETGSSCLCEMLCILFASYLGWLILQEKEAFVLRTGGIIKFSYTFPYNYMLSVNEMHWAEWKR
jgi:hypothetical protein